MTNRCRKTESVDIHQVRAWLAGGARVVLYLRHAERPPLDPADPTFGEGLALTGPGERQARALGEALHGVVHDARLLASPMERTRRTARLIGDAVGATEATVEDAPAIGVGNVFTDAGDAHREMGRVGVMNYIFGYLDAGTAPHACPVREATSLAVEWIQHAATEQFNLYCGHDLTIATALTGLDLAHFQADNWLPFLTGLVMVDHNGQWQNHWFV